MSIYNMPWILVPNRIRGRGGREIDKFRGVDPPIDDNSGSEAWIGSVTRANNATAENPIGCAEVILPDGRRMYLYEAINLAPEEILGKEHMRLHGNNLGVLVKYLDAQFQYGLQAHPTREFAKEMWGSPYGKEESWYVIGVRDDTPEPPYFLLGFKEGVTRERFWEAIKRGNIDELEGMCHKIEVKPGDAGFVRAGAPHALGRGCFVIEVQETSDITIAPVLQETLKSRWKDYRVNDDEETYNKKMLGSFIYDGCSYEEAVKRCMIPRKELRKGDWGVENWIIGPEQTSYFSFSQADVNGSMPLRSTGFPQIAIVLNGDGAISFDGGSIRIKKADEIFLPYRIPNAVVEGTVSIVFCNPEGAE